MTQSESRRVFSRPSSSEKLDVDAAEPGDNDEAGWVQCKACSVLVQSVQRIRELAEVG